MRTRTLPVLPHDDAVSAETHPASTDDPCSCECCTDTIDGYCCSGCQRCCGRCTCGDAANEKSCGGCGSRLRTEADGACGEGW